MKEIKSYYNKTIFNVFILIFSFIFCMQMFFSIFIFQGSIFSFSNKNKFVFAANSEYNGTIYAGDKSSSKVSLMINVYWGTEELEKMLETFAKYGVKTTFFVGGMWAKTHPDLLKRMAEAGHEIASHGYSHKEQGKLGFDANYSEIEKTHKLVKQILGQDMKLFAPPGGSYNKNTISAADALGYKTIMWTRDTIDWRDKDEKLIFTRAVVDMHGGDLILMHPTAATFAALENIILYARNHNLTLTTVSDTLGL